MINTQNKQAALENFLQDRSLGEVKETLVRYLAEVSDVITFEPLPKGRSKIVCEFDCGAYKGSEVLTFRMTQLTPWSVAIQLMSLTSGHHFSYPDAENVLIESMKRRVQP